MYRNRIFALEIVNKIFSAVNCKAVLFVIPIKRINVVLFGKVFSVTFGINSKLGFVFIVMVS